MPFALTQPSHYRVGSAVQKQKLNAGHPPAQLIAIRPFERRASLLEGLVELQLGVVLLTDMLDFLLKLRVVERA